MRCMPPMWMGVPDVKVYIGYDKREAAAASVASKTLRQLSRIEAEFLHLERLRETGLITRPCDRRGEGFKHYDLISNSPASTDFAFTRFLVPILCQGGYALFTDGDVVFLRNPMEMLHGITSAKAAYVV